MGFRGNQGGPVPASNNNGPRPNAGQAGAGNNRVADIKNKITAQLRTPNKDFFSDCASQFAQLVHDEGARRSNKSSQIRRFFEELILWDERCEDSPERCAELLPFIRLMCAKSAYSFGRELISKGFNDVFCHLIQTIEDPKTLQNARLFMEATIGFRRALEEA